MLGGVLDPGGDAIFKASGALSEDLIVDFAAIAPAAARESESLLLLSPMLTNVISIQSASARGWYEH
jgi:hypothetical protein